MARGRARARKRHAVQRVERVEATPETLAKLRPDPLYALLQGLGRGDSKLEAAADEIRAIYMAVVRMLMRKGGLMEDRGGMPEIPAFLAWAHANTYLPWANSTHRLTLEAVIDLVIDREPVRNGCSPENIILALENYAKRIMSRPTFESD